MQLRNQKILHKLKCRYFYVLIFKGKFLFFFNQNVQFLNEDVIFYVFKINFFKIANFSVEINLYSVHIPSTRTKIKLTFQILPYQMIFYFYEMY